MANASSILSPMAEPAAARPYPKTTLLEYCERSYFPTKTHYIQERVCSVIAHLRRCLNREPLLSDLSGDVDRRLFDHLIEAGLHATTASNYCGLLLTLWDFAGARGDVQSHCKRGRKEREPRPGEWHSRPKGASGKPCPICALPARYGGLHRQAPQSDPSSRWLQRRKMVDGWIAAPIGAPRVRKLKRQPTGPTKETLQKIARAASMLADGKTVRQAAAALGMDDSSLGELRAKYPEIWARALDTAMAAMAAVVEAQAGSVEILADPAAYIAKAAAVERWALQAGRQFMPVKSGSLRDFFESYYRPTCLADVTQQSLEGYHLAIRRWALFTGDPPLAEITSATLAFFRTCLEKLPGLTNTGLMRPCTVRNMLAHIQFILDKAGPPMRGNRDAAGILDRVPWIRPPRVDVEVRPTVPFEIIDQFYLGLVAAERPKIPGFRPSAWWRALIVLALNTGLRRRTLFGLKMSDVDWQSRRILIRPANNKSRKRFWMPLNETSFRHLIAIRTDRELVFPWNQDLHDFHKYFHRFQDAAGIPRPQHFGLHGLRRTLATMLYADSPGAAQMALGHSAMATTEAFYVSSGIVATALDALPQPAAFAAAMAESEEVYECIILDEAEGGPTP